MRKIMPEDAVDAIEAVKRDEAIAALQQQFDEFIAETADLLTVTEVRSNAVAGSNNDTEWLTQQLNAVYGAGTYTHPTENGASDGGGTEGVIYNTQSLTLLQV